MYLVIFVDDYSRFTWFYPPKQKSDFYDVLIRFNTFVTNQFSRTIKTFQSDCGTEFTNHRVQISLRSAKYITLFIVPINHLKIVEQNVNIDILQKMGLQCSFTLTLHLIIRQRLSAVLSTQLIVYHLLFFKRNLHLSYYLQCLLIIRVLIRFVVESSHAFVIMWQISLSFVVFLVFLQVTTTFIKGFGVSILCHFIYILLDMLNLLNFVSHSSQILAKLLFQILFSLSFVSLLVLPCLLSHPAWLVHHPQLLSRVPYAMCHLRH